MLEFDEMRKRMDRQQKRMESESLWAFRLGVFMLLVWLLGIASVLGFIGYVVLRLLNHFGV